MKKNSIMLLFIFALFSCSQTVDNSSQPSSPAPMSTNVRVITAPVSNPKLTPPEDRFTEDGDMGVKRSIEGKRKPTGYEF